jgi:hypothetical protein
MSAGSQLGVQAFVDVIRNHAEPLKIQGKTDIDNRIGIFLMLRMMYWQEYLSFWAGDIKPNRKRPKSSGNFRSQQAVLLAGFPSMGIQASR